MLAGSSTTPSIRSSSRRAPARTNFCYALNAIRDGDDAARRPILQQLFAAGGDDAYIQPPFYCDFGRHITLGRRVYFNFNCVILDVCAVAIGDFCFFGPAVQIYTALHPFDHAQRRTQEFGKPVTIGDDVWVGGGAIVCPGVRIGSRTVIGAGSVVTRDVPEGVLAAGNPCRVIRALDH